MPEEILSKTITLIACLILALVFLFLYLKERRQNKANSSPFEQLSDTEEKSYNMLHHAMKSADNIIGNAELEGVKIEAEDRLASKRAEEKFESEMSEDRAELQKELAIQMNQTYQEYLKFVGGLKEQNSEIQSVNQQAIQQRVNAIFDKFEQNLGTFLTSTEQKSIQSIELELRSARQLIDTYKTQQLAIIDENIISILERTLSLVLAKKIPLKDQVDLIYEALNKAKVEKFIV